MNRIIRGICSKLGKALVVCAFALTFLSATSLTVIRMVPCPAAFCRATTTPPEACTHSTHSRHAMRRNPMLGRKGFKWRVKSSLNQPAWLRVVSEMGEIVAPRKELTRRVPESA